MGIWLDQVAKARERSKAFDLPQLVREAKDKTPADLSTPRQLADREMFLRETVGDSKESALVFERIINGSELQDVNYLARGARAAKAIARVAMRDTSGRLVGYGSGFLIAPRVLITNNHVLPAMDSARRSEAQFEYELDIEGKTVGPVTFALDPGKLFFTSEPLDFTVVAIGGDADLSGYGWLPLVGTLGKAADGEWLSIVQHPGGERKQICIRENKLLRRQEDHLWYASDTLGGSSGSPVFNNDWFVVALHHSGVPAEDAEGRMLTVYDRPYDPTRGDREQDIKWVANEGVRVSRIVETLKAALPEHPLLRPVFDATPENSRLVPAAAGRPAAAPLEAAAAPKPPAIDVPFNAAYDDREGYAPGFLGEGVEVALPALSPALEEVAAKLLKPEGTGEYVLKYHNFSLAMHAQRRFALYTAANVDFGGRYEMARPADVWRQDPRISLSAQVTNFYYAGNQFDRGHLTRREDLEFGATRLAALTSAADTCHWTNACPQHARFNQGKALWQGIERHLLEDAITRDSFRAQVITGPILEESDPAWERYPEIHYPVRFWKVVAALNAGGELFATAYILDQSAVIAQYGIEAVPVVPFAAYKTFQVPIAEVERLTQLTFMGGPAGAPVSLSEFDPLRTAESRTVAPEIYEAAGVALQPGYIPLVSLEMIRRKTATPRSQARSPLVRGATSRAAIGTSKSRAKVKRIARNA